MGSQKNIKLLAWFNFFTDFKLYSAIAILYFVHVTGSLALGMSIYSIASISDALFEVPTGILSDMVGRKNTIVLGSIASVSYALCYAIGGSYWILALGAIFQGLSVAFYSGNNDALLHDSLKESGNEKKFHSYLGKLSSLFQLALALGAVIGSFLANNSFILVMWLSVIPQVICFFISLFMVEPRILLQKSTNIYAHMKDALLLFKTNKKLRLVSIAGILGSAVGEASFQLSAAFFNTLWPLWAVGIAKMISYIGATLSFYFSGKIIDRFGALKVLKFEIISNRIANLVALVFPSMVSPVLMASTSLTFGVGSVATNSLLQREFTVKQRATMGSLNSLGGSLAFGVFSILLGFIADTTSLTTALIVAHLLLLLPLYFYRKVFVHEVTQALADRSK